jgi:hypothetical protein
MNPLKPTDVRTVWSGIRPKLAEIAERNEADWTCEEIYHAMRIGTAFLFASDDGDFCVLTMQLNQYTLESECFIWAAYNAAAPLEVRTDEVRTIARQAGAARLVMSSQRRGWERRPDWRMRETIYTMEL